MIISQHNNDMAKIAMKQRRNCAFKAIRFHDPNDTMKEVKKKKGKLEKAGKIKR